MFFYVIPFISLKKENVGNEFCSQISSCHLLLLHTWISLNSLPLCYIFVKFLLLIHSALRKLIVVLNVLRLFMPENVFLVFLMWMTPHLNTEFLGSAFILQGSIGISLLVFVVMEESETNLIFAPGRDA